LPCHLWKMHLKIFWLSLQFVQFCVLTSSWFLLWSLVTQASIEILPITNGTFPLLSFWTSLFLCSYTRRTLLSGGAWPSKTRGGEKGASHLICVAAAASVLGGLQCLLPPFFWRRRSCFISTNNAQWIEVQPSHRTKLNVETIFTWCVFRGVGEV